MMTVRELMQYLQNCDPEAVVMLDGTGGPLGYIKQEIANELELYLEDGKPYIELGVER